MSEACFHYMNDHGVEFVWHGGEYIDVGMTAVEDTGPFNNLGQPSYNAGEFIAVDVINVWNHKDDEPIIERTLQAFEEHCDEWFEENDGS